MRVVKKSWFDGRIRRAVIGKYRRRTSLIRGRLLALLALSINILNERISFEFKVALFVSLIVGFVLICKDTVDIDRMGIWRDSKKRQKKKGSSTESVG